MHLRSRESRLEDAGKCCLMSAFLMFAIAPAIAQPPAPQKNTPPQATASAATSTQPTLDRGPRSGALTGSRPAARAAREPAGGALGTIARGTGGKFTLRENAYEVRLNASVFDLTGRSVQTLDKDAFRVYEDGVPQTIASFRHEDLPVSLGILIDSSGSMYDKRAAVDQASLDLVKLSNPEDEAFLVDFSWEAFIDQDFTNDIDKLQQGLSYIKSSGGTAIYDALVASADYLSKNAKHPKQVLLVMTDGEDNASSATLDQAVRQHPGLRRAGDLLHRTAVWGRYGEGRVAPCARVLESLSEETGGQAYFPKSIKDVDAIAKEVAQRHSHAVHDCLSLDEVADAGRVPRGPRGGEGEGLQQALGAHA